jgi:hypothetical protein
MQRSRTTSNCRREARFAIAVACIIAACTVAPAQAAATSGTQDHCSLQIILVMARPGTERPSAPVVASLARKARVSLVFLRDAGTSSYVFRLSTGSGKDSCQRGIERLRSDSRVQSVDLDARRRGNQLEP